MELVNCASLVVWIERPALATEPVVLERYGHAAGVLGSPEHHARLVAALEDAEDVEAFDAAMAEEGANIPWDQAEVDLGWE